MKRKKLFLYVLAASILILIVMIKAQENETFYETSFDGAWEGSIRIRTQSGSREFPAVLNLNSREKIGIGFSLLSDNLQTAPKGLDFYSLKSFTRNGNKIVISIEDEAESNERSENKTFTHTITLSYKKAKGFLKGNFKSTDPTIKGKRSMLLYPQGPTKVLQKIWTGSITLKKKKKAVILQLIQKNALGEKEATQNTEVSGYGFIGDDYGKITNGTFNGKKFTGNLNLSNELVLLDFSLKTGPKLRGKLNGATFKKNVLLKPAGTTGNVLNVNDANPKELVLGETNVVTIEGNNFFPGAMVHVNNAEVKVDIVEYTSKSKIVVHLVPSENIPAGQKISLRVVNVNGEFVDRTDIFTTKLKEDPFTVSFAQDIQPVFNQSCALSGCHTGSSPSQGMNLSLGQAYSNIVNVASGQRPDLMRIKPFDTNASYLISKIKGEDINGSRMPLGSPQLSAEVIAKFDNWVKEGAVNN